MHRAAYDIAALLIGALITIGAVVSTTGPLPPRMAEAPFHPMLA